MLWSGQRDSNPRMMAWEAIALPLGDARMCKRILSQLPNPSHPNVPRARRAHIRRSGVTVGQSLAQGIGKLTARRPCYHVPPIVAKERPCPNFPLRQPRSATSPQEGPWQRTSAPASRPGARSGVATPSSVARRSQRAMRGSLRASGSSGGETEHHIGARGRDNAAQYEKGHAQRRGLNIPWWRRWGSNPRPQACKARALPAELRPR